MLDDITDASEKASVRQELSSISCANIDRHLVETKENELLVEAKKKSMTKLGLETISDLDTSILHFRCAMHPLLQFADVAEHVIKDFESNEHSCKKGFLCRGESGTTYNTLWDTSKLFFKDGVGDPLLSSAYLEKHGIDTVPWTVQHFLS